MKYILIDTTKTDMFTKEFETAEEAIKQGDHDFSYLTDHDKAQREEFYVLESADPDEEAINHFDGNIVKRWM